VSRRISIIISSGLAAISCAFGEPDERDARAQALVGVGGPTLLVNECSSGKSGWVELFNSSAAAVDVAADDGFCWFVDDQQAGGPPKRITDLNVQHAASSTTCSDAGRGPGCALVAPGERVWVDYAWINAASNDVCRLVRAAKLGSSCDAVLIEEDSGGPTSAKSAGQCFGRSYDGGPWSSGAIACTPNGESNGTPPPFAGPRVVINEFAAGSSGWVELYNAGGAEANLGGYQIDDIVGGGTAPKTIAAGTLLAPGTRLVIAYSGINTASADEVRLVDPGSGAAGPGDATTNRYAGSSIAGLCFGRQPDGGAWADAAIACSKGRSNSEAALVSLGSPSALLLRGTIVTPTGPISGEILIESDVITCVAVSCSGVSQSGQPSVVETNGIVLPGMIDTHNHILFDIFDETHWTPPKLYTNHHQWTKDPKYKALVNAKQHLNGEYSSPVNVGCELNKYGELKGMIAGTTSIVGAANPGNKSCYGSLARTIDQSANDLGADKVQVATLMPTTRSADSTCNNFAAGSTDAYLIHIGEGVDQSALAEYEHLRTLPTDDGCLHAPQTAIVHGTAFGATQFAEMAATGMSLVWSPRSNVFLYGQGTDLSKTTDIPLALSYGINVSLAPDWSIGGSQNLLDELRFAEQVDTQRFGNLLSSRDLFEMVTIRAAKVLGLEQVIGSIEPGKKADLMVIGGSPDAPYDALLAATPRDVRMVVVGGVVLYGDPQLALVGPSEPGCEAIEICGQSKFVCVAEQGGTASNKLGQTLAEIETVLETELASYDALDLSPWDFSPIAPLVKCP
jgi:5-methylthioadenosine/S-adenosylhomocysteine deaminase